MRHVASGGVAAPAYDLDAFILTNTTVVSPPLCPEIRLHLLKPDAPMKDTAPLMNGEPLLFAWEGPRPYWAFAWAAGQGLARFILDYPAYVSGRTVLDLGSGSGICAIAAAMGGAVSVTAADIDPVALCAVRLNALLNGVVVEPVQGDTRDGIPGDWGAIVAADAFYHGQDHRWLLHSAASGRTVLIGDPSCRGFPKHCCEELAVYRTRTVPELEEWTADVQILRVRRDAQVQGE
jgi:predicted nicotinamide N-methyase